MQLRGSFGVDSGNKLIGVQVLQAYIGAAPDATLHVGDQVYTIVARMIYKLQFIAC